MVSRWRYDDAASTHNRFSNKAGHIFGAEFQNLVFKICHFLIAERFDRHSVWPSIGIGRWNVVDQIRREVKPLMIEFHACHRHGEVRAAVVAIYPGNDLFLVFLTKTVEVKMNYADCGIVRHRAACTKKHVIKMPRC